VSEEKPFRSDEGSLLDSDRAWEEWGRREPYFGVLTHPKFRRAQMTEQDRGEFFYSGELHVDKVMQVIRRHIDASFNPSSILDFGCGVGRTTIPFARLSSQVVGADVSSTMLQEAKRNCEAHQVRNVRLVVTDDSLAQLDGSFDLVHSFIVFQHIPHDRGMVIFRNLLARVRTGGVCAIHFSHSKRPYIAPATADGTAEAGLVTPPVVQVRETDPEMQMNLYTMNELLMLIQEAGGRSLHAELTDHGHELGIFLFFAIGTPALVYF
jgi:ubiquinone/menaquinone biosynthesis C-methylase UbiE